MFILTLVRAAGTVLKTASASYWSTQFSVLVLVQPLICRDDYFIFEILITNG
jgi:hypothetical protein